MDKKIIMGIVVLVILVVSGALIAFREQPELSEDKVIELISDKIKKTYNVNEIEDLKAILTNYKGYDVYNVTANFNDSTFQYEVYYIVNINDESILLANSRYERIDL